MSAVTGIEQVVRNLSMIEKNIVQEIVYGAEAVQAKVVNDARVICPTGFTGALAQSIEAGDITITDANVEALVNAKADYASYVEWGTRPHFPPIDALKDWAAKFLGDPKLAFIIARAIARRGTRPYNFMGQALLANIDTFRSAISAAVLRGLAAGSRS
jgi:hypothetical protein